MSADVSVLLVETEVRPHEAYQGDPASVDGSPWTAFIPALHRLLANPRGNEAFPVPPARPSDDPLFTHCAYWEAAAYLLTYLMGWRDPAAGLRWWYEVGQPTEDVRLAVLKACWGFERQIDLLAAWFWSSGGSLWPAPAGSTPEVDALARPFIGADGEHSWRGGSPFGGGYNPLHLGDAGEAEARRGAPGLLLPTGAEQRRAVLLLDAAPGWYHWLAEQGTTLPDLGERSWHIEVVVRPIGSLGTFRRSRVTGLWFQGKHSTHLRGNPQTAAP